MDQSQDFVSRMHRASRRSRKGIDVVGPAQTRTHARNQRLAEILERHRAEGVHRGRYEEPHLKITRVVSYVMAFAMGGLAAMIARVLRYQISGAELQATGDMDFVIDVVFAISIAFLLREIVSLSAVKRMGTQLAGILLAIMTMHNMVHAMPETFSRLFSAQWVEHVTATTEPKTLYFRGHSYHI
ncbi:hypothetical protein Q4560_00360 [Celeribacter halophilus]|jgi:ABC-type multidrug transport system fused ATPase/permease subunit|uniref:Uncharacterized protein n=1 Tax=Celeribacter halophilus TaxID=576117 RepID=A0A1I3Q0D8_9RHOB|nr:hypothetical protein [Celeribacter halophilus]MBU2890746.1 hypothetical protein [Celeribacter halophilus]MDO6455502.1 hypothetical protein [Celeribacter halophilus]MDO6510089.1 hypothetical protein [Celeribacter halophilus]MDO6721706.1 hypothetical protein [Celeribacter halophilus]PZX13998.1 hypothetical protein LX82_00797 [Celeribacter halophilus]